MGFIKDVTAHTVAGNAGGIVVPLADPGVLIRAGQSVSGSKGIRKSTNNGMTWTDQQIYSSSSFDTRLTFVDSRGYIFVGTIASLLNGQLFRSTDNGETWAIVATSEGSGWWYMCEQPTTGYLYANEYSVGNRDAAELYAYNIWRSTDAGATWQKFYTATKQSSPGAFDGTRHIHHVHCDSFGRLYTGFGDPTFAGQATYAYRLNDNGTLGAAMSTADNGFTAFIEADNGALLFGGDATPVSIKEYEPLGNILTTRLNIVTDYRSFYDTAILDMDKGADGVLYALSNGLGGVRPSVIFASPDDGITWNILLYTRLTVGASYLNVGQGRVFIGQAQTNGTPYLSIPDYTRAEIATKRLSVR